MAKIIVVTKKNQTDATVSWWLAESNPYGSEPIRITEPFPEDLKEAWTEDFIKFIEEAAPQLMWFEERDGKSETVGSTIMENREIIFPD